MKQNHADNLQRRSRAGKIAVNSSAALRDPPQPLSTVTLSTHNRPRPPGRRMSGRGLPRLAWCVHLSSEAGGNQRRHSGFRGM